MSNLETRKINEMTKRFYERHARSFSATRNAPWKGWEMMLPEIQALTQVAQDEELPLQVLDIGCGNLRFERFLTEKLPQGLPIEAVCVDSCAPLMDEGALAECLGLTVRTIEGDVIAALDGGSNDLEEMIPDKRRGTFDLTVAFGFMHHIPSFEGRLRLLTALIAQTRRGGMVAVSFWQFAHDEGLRAKALTATKQAQRFAIDLDPSAGDYGLFWQDDETQMRYCHHFSEEEIERLVETVSLSARQVRRFSADGRTDDLNRYVVLEVL